MNFLERHGGILAQEQFTLYRIQESYFHPLSPAWKMSAKPLLFWAQLVGYTAELGHIAMRIFRTPATSVPSEQSFSAHNLIHDKRQNKHNPEQVDKLVFVHINKRVLDRKIKDTRGWIDVTEDELVDLEDRFMSVQSALDLA